MKGKWDIVVLWAFIMASVFVMTQGYCSVANGLTASGPESYKTPIPMFLDGGNTARDISAPWSTTLVLISSSADNAVRLSSPAAIAAPGYTGPADPSAGNLGLSVYRERCVVNYSSNTELRLYWDSNYTTFSDTFGVVLSSVSPTSGIRNFNNTFCTSSQNEIWGIWGGTNLGTQPVGAGAGGYESYFDKAKRR